MLFSYAWKSNIHPIVLSYAEWHKNYTVAWLYKGNNATADISPVVFEFLEVT